MKWSTAAVSAALSLAATSAAIASEFDLSAARGFTVPRGVVALASADFDEDGAPDLAMAGSAGVLIRVFADGRFHRFTEVWVAAGGPARLGIAAGDVDLDGHADLAVASGDGVEIFYGDGRFGFTASTLASLGTPFGHVALSDLNGDGRQDVCGVAQVLGVLFAWLQIGSSPRTFLSPANVRLGSGDARIAALDFDGDGRADVAVAQNPVSLLKVLGGNGAGGFSSNRDFAVLGRPSDIAQADLDHDGRDDVALAILTGGVDVFRGDQVQGLVPAGGFPSAIQPGRIALADVDGNGFEDLVATAGTGVWVAGDGAGGFSQPRSIPSGQFADALLARDLSGDGFVDAVLTSGSVGSGSLVLGAASTGFLEPPRFQTRFPSSAAAGDFNRDGLPDVAIGGRLSSTQHRAYLLFGDGRGGALSTGEAEIRAIPSHLAVGDLDADSNPDLFATVFSQNRVMHLRGTGSGFVDLGDIAAGIGPVASAVGDVDGDGAADLIVANRESRDFGVYFGDGLGGFPAGGLVVLSSRPHGVVLADFDRDGRLDIAAPGQFPAAAVVAFSEPGRAFTPASLGPTGAMPASVAADDLDSDGFLDLLVADGAAAGIVALFGDGARGFPRFATFPAVAPMSRADLADVTGDGRPEAVLSLALHGFVSVVPGDGRGSFEPPATYAVGRSEAYTVTADLDGNGSAEIAAAGSLVHETQFLSFRASDVTVALRGTVNSRAGETQDVLFVNSSAGDLARRIVVRPTDLVSCVVRRPPLAVSGAPFAAYAWRAEPSPSTLRAAPGGIGTMALPFPLRPGDPAPRVTWNNAGAVSRLGAATRPSSPATSILFFAPNGLGVRGTFVIQGLIVDPGGPDGRAAVTNGVILEVK